MKPISQWTFMVFLSNDNDSEMYGNFDISRMMQVGSTQNVNVIAFQDRKSDCPELFKIEKNKRNVIKKFNKIDSGDYNELINFVKYAQENFPAKNYALVLSNNVMHWDRSSDKEVYNWFAYDDDTENKITAVKLNIALEKIKEIIGKKIDLLGFDEDMMQRLEYCFEFKENVDFIIASEDTMQINGWPYDEIIKCLTLNPDLSPKDFAIKIVELYNDFYTKVDKSSTISVIDASKIDKVIKKLDILLENLISKLNDPKFIDIIYNTVSIYLHKFYIRNHCDFVHFLELFKKISNDEKINLAASELIESVVTNNEKLVIANKTTGSVNKNANGISIFFSLYSIDNDYKSLKFSKTKWSEFLNLYHEKRKEFIKH